MFTENIRTLSGPNYWSVKHHSLVVISLSLKDPDKVEINRFQDFFTTFPDLLCHTKNVETINDKNEEVGEILIKIVESTLKVIHSKTNIPLEFIENKKVEKNKYKIIFTYKEKRSGIFAAESALRFIKAYLKGEDYNIADDLEKLKTIYEENCFGPSTSSIINEAKKRNIPVSILDDEAFIQFGYGKNLKRIDATLASTTGAIAVDKVSDKHLTKKLLAAACIPVPKGRVIECADQLQDVIDAIEYPVVIKPLDGNQGKGTTTNICDLQTAEIAFGRAKEISKKIIVEKFISGCDFRVLVINNKFIAAAKRTPASIKGNGKLTIKELIEECNTDPKRGNGHSNILTAITIDDDTKGCLSSKNISVDYIPKNGEEIILKTTSNLSTGGTAEDIPDFVHPTNRQLFERVARTIGLDICGIDIMVPDLTSPIVENGGAIIEVNAAPGFRMHLQPTTGKKRNVAKPVVDMLFPGTDGRIPIIAVTGTNGKTTTTRLVACMAQQHGYSTGFTTTDGIYLNKELLYKGDCSGPSSARVLLNDPAVEFAVLETARGGLLRSGLAFDSCECSIITNVAEDHLGLNDIHTLEQLAEVKAVLSKIVQPKGYVILNADDDRVYSMKDNASGRVALFSLHADNIRIQRHCEAGGLAAYYEGGYIIIRSANKLILVEEVENIPLTFGGKAKFNIANILGAVLAAYTTGISMPAIRCTLRSIRSTFDQTPGRLNFIECEDHTVLLDYAHNPHGLRALGEFVKELPATKKIGIIAGVGDRRNEDLIAMGREAGKIFDELMIRMDEDLRGRTEFEIVSLIRSGIMETAPHKPIAHFKTEREACDYAMDAHAPGALIVLLVENVQQVYERVMQIKHAQEKNILSFKRAV
jgi:cyanophycin synthetase